MCILFDIFRKAASHYHLRSRGRQFPPIRLQETKNLVSRPFTLEAKVQRPSLSQMPPWYYFLTKVTNSQRKFGLDRIENPNYGQEAVNFSTLKYNSLTTSCPLDWRGCFGQGIKWGCSFCLWTLGLAFGGFTLWPSKLRGRGSSWPNVWTWALPLEASHYAWPKASNSCI
jgi:hypothetical protein